MEIEQFSEKIANILNCINHKNRTQSCKRFNNWLLYAMINRSE